MAMDLDQRTIAAAIAEVAAEVAAAEHEDGPAALANRSRWDLVDQEAWSTRNMDDEALREAVVNDLVVAHDLRTGGREFAFTRETLVRHVVPGGRERVLAALTDPTVASFLERRGDDELRIDPAHLQDACDYCGLWPEGITPLTAEPVFYAGRLTPTK